MNLKKTALTLSTLSLFAGMPLAQAHEVTYNVTQTYNQVAYNNSHPTWDTIFNGSFVYDEDTMTVSNLTGSLTQAMTGNTVSRLLNYQLSSVYDAALGGYLVTSFLQNTTDTFKNSGGVAGVTGWATGGTQTYGNQNAYATIFVNTANPLAALTQDQTNKLAYADCTTGSLMGGMSVCMTGWTKITNGIAGAGGMMQGTYPITQTITAAVPEPETYALLLAGLGILVTVARRRQIL